MAAEPSPHETKRIDLEIVRTDDLELPKRGRPVRLSLRVFVRICHAVEKGSAITHACQSELVTYSHFRFRVSKSPRLQERLKEAEECRDQVWRSEALASIRAAFPKNWVSGMTYLERKYPNEFSLRNVTRTDDTGSQLVGNEIPISRLQEYGRLMIELASENAEKQLAQTPNPPSEAIGE